MRRVYVKNLFQVFVDTLMQRVPEARMWTAAFLAWCLSAAFVKRNVVNFFYPSFDCVELIVEVHLQLYMGEITTTVMFCMILGFRLSSSR